MYCTYCGAQNPKDYRFCHKCGKPRPEMASEAPRGELADAHRLRKKIVNAILEANRTGKTLYDFIDIKADMSLFRFLADPTQEQLEALFTMRAEETEALGWEGVLEFTSFLKKLARRMGWEKLQKEVFLLRRPLLQVSFEVLKFRKSYLVYGQLSAEYLEEVQELGSEILGSAHSLYRLEGMLYLAEAMFLLGHHEDASEKLRLLEAMIYSTRQIQGLSEEELQVLAATEESFNDLKTQFGGGGIAESRKRQGRWEYKEFTRQFDEPLNVRADEEGLFVLYSKAEVLALQMKNDLSREGWELAESISNVDLLENDRVNYEVEQYGLIRKQKSLKAKSVTLKFKRWVE